MVTYSVHVPCPVRKRILSRMHAWMSHSVSANKKITVMLQYIYLQKKKTLCSYLISSLRWIPDVWLLLRRAKNSPWMRAVSPILSVGKIVPKSTSGQAMKHSLTSTFFHATGVPAESDIWILGIPPGGVLRRVLKPKAAFRGHCCWVSWPPPVPLGTPSVHLSPMTLGSYCLPCHIFQPGVNQ